MSKEYIIYCDESIAKGTHYSDFYGGVLVSSEHINQVQEFLKVKKEQLGVFEEIKWTKTNEFTLEGYREMMTAFFDLLETDVLKVRIMFRQSAFQAANLTNDQKEVHYFLLYYQFVKHAFGLVYSNDTANEVYLRTYFDELPENPLKAELFKNYIYGLQSLRGFEEAKIKIRREDILEVNSKHHILLQCLDVVLGAIAFRLNDLHKVKDPVTNLRGKRTKAKEKL